MTVNNKENAKLFKALADENRLAILQMLMNGAKCACDLLEEMNITQPTLSHHMKILCDAGIVDCCKNGKWMHYSICVDTSKKLKQVLEAYTLSDKQACAYKKCEFQSEKCTK